jgi:hypothetical protein
MENKDFTQYPEALELKQLGFDEPCFGYYGNSEEDSTIVLELRTISQEGDLAKRICSAPTYSQAFRWFRKEYALESYIRANLCVDVPKTYQFNIGDNIDDVWYDTYEEAELACLKKLIEIVKGGNK